VAPDTLFGDIASESQQIQATLDTILAESSIQFQPDSASLTSGGQDAVVKIAEALKASPGARVTVTGHTDSNGDADRNLALSVSRAEAVRADLGQLGIDVARITTVGEGGKKPLVANDTPANRKKNRRIEIRVD
jgi:OmpA-OmpF porin, OOP family